RSAHVLAAEAVGASPGELRVEHRAARREGQRGGRGVLREGQCRAGGIRPDLERRIRGGEGTDRVRGSRLIQANRLAQTEGVAREGDGAVRDGAEAGDVLGPSDRRTEQHDEGRGRACPPPTAPPESLADARSSVPFTRAGSPRLSWIYRQDPRPGLSPNRSRGHARTNGICSRFA